jgi:regulatory protein
MRRPGGRKTLEPEQAADAILARHVATSLLAGRDHAIADLSRKLQQRGFTPPAIATALAELKGSNALDDERYGQNVVRYRSRRGQGPARIRLELRRSGVNAELADAAVKGGDDAPDFNALARQARIRKFGPDIPIDWKDRAKQARFLQYRGFSNDHIRAALEGDPEADSDSDAGSKPDQS